MFHRILTNTLLVTLLSLLFIQPLLAGGWTVVTLEELPVQVQAGEPIPVSFLVQQHGRHPLQLKAGEMVIRLWQEASNKTLRIEAQITDQPGYYTAEISFPSSGVWSWEVRPGGFPPAAMPDLTVAAGTIQPGVPSQTAPSQWGWWQQVAFQIISSLRRPTEPAPAAAALDLTQDPVAYGKALFVAKGCVTCHVHGQVATDFSVGIGPELTAYTVIPEYVRVWLRDPKSIKPLTEMPALPMPDGEVEALIAFLSASRK